MITGFVPATTSATPATGLATSRIRATDAAIADFDPDNAIDPDFRVFATGCGLAIGVRPSNCLSEFAALHPVMIGGSFEGISELEAGDIDLNGDADLAWVDRTNGYGYRLYDGDGVFDSSPISLGGGDITDLELLDDDGDRGSLVASASRSTTPLAGFQAAASCRFRISTSL